MLGMLAGLMVLSGIAQASSEPNQHPGEPSPHPGLLPAVSVEVEADEPVSSDTDVLPASWFLPATDTSACPPTCQPGSTLTPCPEECGDELCATCADKYCGRGVDHLGALWGLTIGDGTVARTVGRAPVLLTAELLDLHAQAWLYLSDCWADGWIHTHLEPYYENRAGAVCGAQCKLVNWRLSSMYLIGCMPEGYNLNGFIRHSNQAVFHASPLSPDSPVQPNTSPETAQAVDGATYKSLHQIQASIEPPAGALPEDRSAPVYASLGQRTHVPGTQRLWNATSFYWHASLLNHQPLYFEDVNLERHGYSYGVLQPVASGVKFFGTLPALPYLMAAHPSSTTRYTLGETRPGNAADYVVEFPPLNLDAGFVQACAVTGLIFLLP